MSGCFTRNSGQDNWTGPLHSICSRGCVNPGHQVTVATKLYTMAPDVCEFCVRNLLHGTCLMPRILRSLFSFWKICAPLRKVNSHSYTGIVNTAFCQKSGIQSECTQNRFKYSVCLWAPPTNGTSCTVGFTRSFSTPLARWFNAVSVTLCGPHSYNFVSADVFAFRLSKNLWQHSKKHPVRRGRCGLRLAHMMLGVDVSTELITLLNVFHP